MTCDRHYKENFASSKTIHKSEHELEVLNSAFLLSLTEHRVKYSLTKDQQNDHIENNHTF